MKVDRRALEELREEIERLRLHAHFLTRVSGRLLGSSSAAYHVIHERFRESVQHGCHEAERALRQLELATPVTVPDAAIIGETPRGI